MADGALHLLLNARAGPQDALCRHHGACAQPAFEEVEEVHPMLDEDAAAFLAIPEPVVRAQPFVTGVVFEPTMQAGPEHTGGHQIPRGLIERVVPLHQVGDAEEVPLPGQGQQVICLLHGHGQRLLTEHMFPRQECRPGLGVVEKRRRGDVNEVHLRTRQQCVQIHEVRHAKAAGHGESRLPQGACDPDELHPRYLEKLLKGKEAEAPRTYGTDTERVRIHSRRGNPSPHRGMNTTLTNKKSCVRLPVGPALWARWRNGRRSIRHTVVGFRGRDS